MTTTNKSLAQPASNSSNWDVPLNANFGVIDASLGSTTSINVTSVNTTPVTLTATQYQSLIVKFSGTLSNNVRYNLPSGVGGQWTVYNNTSGAYSVTFGSLGGGTTIAITQGAKAILTCDGTNVFYADDSRTSPGGSNTQVQYNNSGAFAGSANLTFDGTSLSAGNYFIASGVNAATFGYADVSANIYTYNATGAGGVTNTVAINAGGVNRAKFDSSGNISFNGNIGIGTATPASKLQVVGGSILIDNASAYYCKSSGGTPLTVSYLDGSNNLVIGDGNIAGNISFYNNGSNSLVIDTDGNACVGVGSQVGRGFNSGVAAKGIYCRTGYAGSFNNNVFNIAWDGANSNLWINTTNLGIISIFSDRRVKKDIVSLGHGALDQVMALRPVSYAIKNVDIWKEDGTVKRGFIADEVEAVEPSAVIGAAGAVTEDGGIQPQRLDPLALIATLTKAIQELKAEFDSYKAAHP